MPMKISTKWDSKHAFLFLYNVVLTADSVLHHCTIPDFRFSHSFCSILSLIPQPHILSLDVPATTSTPILSHHKRY